MFPRTSFRATGIVIGASISPVPWVRPLAFVFSDISGVRFGVLEPGVSVAFELTENKLPPSRPGIACTRRTSGWKILGSAIFPSTDLPTNMFSSRQIERSVGEITPKSFLSPSVIYPETM